jgi:hypothetical protein
MYLIVHTIYSDSMSEMHLFVHIIFSKQLINVYIFSKDSVLIRFTLSVFALRLFASFPLRTCIFLFFLLQQNISFTVPVNLYPSINIKTVF